MGKKFANHFETFWVWFTVIILSTWFGSQLNIMNKIIIVVAVVCWSILCFKAYDDKSIITGHYHLPYFLEQFIFWIVVELFLLDIFFTLTTFVKWIVLIGAIGLFAFGIEQTKTGITILKANKKNK